MRDVDEIKKEIKTLKRKNKRLRDTNNQLALEYAELISIPEEQRTGLHNLRIGEINYDTSYNNLTISTNEFYIKELEKELANEQGQMQPS